MKFDQIHPRSALLGGLVIGLTVVLASAAQQSTVTVLESRRPTHQAAMAQQIFLDARTPISSLPFTVNKCGSYFLTKCLKGVSGQDGITINANDVTIDLNGFTLIGVSGSLDAITTTGTPVNVTIHSGAVRAWGGDGVDLVGALNSVVTDIQAYQCDHGIVVNRGIVRNSVARECDVGIEARTSLVQNCLAEFNTSSGILGGSSIITQCYAAINCGPGIEIGAECTVKDNLSGSNLGPGILTTSTQNHISDNTLFDNVPGIQSSGGNMILSNTTSWGAFILAATDTYGPIVNVPGVGSIVGTADADHPWANFQF